MATEEDFSFPTTTDPPPRFFESPRLWRTTSLVSPPDDHTPKRLDEASNKKSKSVHRRKSFSIIECGMKTTSHEEGSYGSDHEDDEDEEERMDILWEDLNEEFSGNSKSSSMADSDHHQHLHMPSRKMLNFGCVQSLTLSRPNKKPSILEFMKDLKKIFLLQNSHRSMKKTQR